MTDTIADQLTRRLRDALTDLQAVLDDNTRAHEANAQLADENKELRRELERLRQTKATARRENAAKWNTQREAWMAHIRSLEEALTRRNRQIGDCIAAIGLSEKRIRELENELATSNAKPEANADPNSDGYHTFEELYDYRAVLHAAAVRAWRKIDGVHVIKSRRHADGEECFGGGWFIVQATLPEGQVSNHYPEKYWDLFDCPERHTASEWDGHTSAVALERMINHERNHDE